MAKNSDITKRAYTVYAIRCTETCKVYIGSTSNLQNRICSHFNDLRAGRKPKTSNVHGFHTGDAWQADYNKYGEGAFEVYVLQEGISHYDRLKVEGEWIARYDSANPKYGYNASSLQGKPVFEIKPGLPPALVCWEPIAQ